MKKYKILIVCIGLVAVAGMLNGIMDTLHFHYSSSIFPQNQNDTFLWGDQQFWDPESSWRNKYKNWPLDPREKFWGSTRWFVMFTDGWHLVKTFMFGCLHLAIIIPIVYYYKFPRWVIFVAVIPLNLFLGAAFTITYGWVLLK